MVTKDNVKYRKANNSGRGESMSGTNIVTATQNNYFDDVSQPEQIGGHTEYRVFYVVNDHTTEKLTNNNIWLSSDQKSTAHSYVQWAIDPIAQNPVYPFHPTLYFDGVDDYLDCGNHASLWSLGLTKLSMLFWIFPTAAGDGNDRLVFGHGGASNHGFRCFIDLTSSVRIRFQIKSSAGTTFTAFSDSLNLNQWNHIACIYDSTLGSQNIKIYVNNILGATTANFTETINVSDILRFGDTSNDYQGYLKDIKWFTNIALNAEQINDNFNGDEDNVDTSYWQKLEENTGNPVDEKTAKVATLVNGTEWRTSQEIASSTTSPVGISWQGVSNGPVSNTPNLGELTANLGRICPIWVKWVVEDTEQDGANDFCIFTVEGTIPVGATPPAENPNTPDDPQPQPPADDFVFAACGDWGTESKTTEVVQGIRDHVPKPKVLVGVGDNAYDSGNDAVDEWLSRVKSLDHKQGSSVHLITAFGNHDNDESEDTDNETRLKNHFGYGATWNKFDYENVRFITIDNTESTSFGSGSSQHTQIKNWLIEGRNKQEIDWIVVAFHKPMFGNSSEHGYNSGNFNQAYFPLFDQYKVDLLLCGHNHHMAQSSQVTWNSSNSTEPNIKDSATPYIGGVGRVHCVVGTGGHDADDLYEMSDGDDIEWVNDNEHGALFVTITNTSNTTTMTGRFKNEDGTTLRTFVITRTTT